MIENKFNHLNPAHPPLGPQTNTTSSPPGRTSAAERNQNIKTRCRISTCLASPDQHGHQCSTSPAENFGGRGDDQHWLRNQANSTFFKGIQRNSN